MVFDGARNPRYRADIAIKDGDRRDRPSGRATERRGSSTRRDARRPWLHRPSHPLRRARSSGIPIARSRAGTACTSVVIGNCGFGLRARSCPRLRDRAMLTHDAHRGHPARVDAGRHPVGLGDLPRSSSTAWTHAQGRQRAALRAAHAAAHLGDGAGAAKSRELRPTPSTREMCRLLNEAMDAGALRMVGAAAAAQRRSIACSATTTAPPMATDLMHDETALALAGCWASATRALSR